MGLKLIHAGEKGPLGTWLYQAMYLIEAWGSFTNMA